jgi:predicted TIM-barrel fold metal-dependent hydrolase
MTTARWALLALFLAVVNVAVWVRPHARSAPAAAVRAGAYLDEDVDDRELPSLPEPRFAAVDVHVHIQTAEDVERLLAAMDERGIRRSCLLGSPRVTFDHRGHEGFDGFHENNEVLLAAKKRHPDRLCAFVTLHPTDADIVEQLRDYVARGADGLKLYLGHGASAGSEPFHVMALDDARMMPLYDYAERIQLPITMHVDLVQYYDELERVMERHPRLRLNLPHFGLHKNTAKRMARLGALLDRYPNLYVDVSFGAADFQVDGFEVLASERVRTVAFLTRYADRVLFGSDLVITEEVSEAQMAATIGSYQRLLELDRFRFFLRPARPLHGLALPRAVLEQIYERTPAAFLGLDAAGALPTTRSESPSSITDQRKLSSALTGSP